MATTAAPVAALSGPNVKVWDLTAVLDADNLVTIAHGFGEIPVIVSIERTVATNPAATWHEVIASRDATNVVIGKGTAGGSGVAGVSARVTIERPHSIMK